MTDCQQLADTANNLVNRLHGVQDLDTQAQFAQAMADIRKQQKLNGCLDSPLIAWFSLGGHDLPQITVQNNVDGRLELFALGGDRAVYHRWQTAPNGHWVPQTNLQEKTPAI